MPQGRDFALVERADARLHVGAERGGGGFVEREGRGDPVAEVGETLPGRGDCLGRCPVALQRGLFAVARLRLAAERRNARYIAAGVASFQAVSLHEADFGAARFDKIFAIHVGVFSRGQPDREVAIVRKHLAPGGTFSLPYQPLDPDAVGATAATLSAALTERGFTVVDTIVGELASGPVGCVVAEASAG